MSVYKYSDGEAALYRMALTVDNTAGAVAAIDFLFVLGTLIPDVDTFWDNVQPDGYDVRVVDPDGRTLLTHDVGSWSKANRTGTISVDGYQAPATKQLLIWLVWGKPSGDATDVTSSVTISSPKTTYAFLADPTQADPAARVESIQRTRARATVPTPELRKETGESLYVFHRAPLLRRSALTAFADSQDYDCPQSAAHDVVDANGSDASTMYTAATGRWATGPGPEYAPWYAFLLTAGTNDTSYTHRVAFTTEAGEVLRTTGGVRVRNALAS